MTYILIALTVGIGILLFFIHKPLIRLIAERKAIPKIENILFKSKEYNKSMVLDIIHELTSYRLSDEMIMDYFYKIKGIQVLNNKPVDFWIKIYLATPTKIKLNYFEQVKFYETFLNFPKINKAITKNSNAEKNPQRIDNFKTQVKKQLTKNLISQRFA